MDKVILYTTEDNQARFELQIFDEQVWLTQADLSDLYQTSKQNISKHIRSILSEGEVDEVSTVNLKLTVQNEGGRLIRRRVAYYALPLIIAVGYRVRSTRGTQFRQWATDRLSEYMLKGFTIDDRRLKGTGGGDYWRELLERIRDIRSSEKAMYRQVLDLYATSVDYNPKSSESIKFFQTVQNKLHYATSEQTAAELVYTRADSAQDFMGLRSFQGAFPTLREAKIAKNYLSQDELFRLNRLVSAFFDLAEIKAQDQVPMYMRDWIAELDKFSSIYGKGVLPNAGTISREEADKKATEEYRAYESRTLSPVEREYIQTIKQLAQKIDKENRKKPKWKL